MPQPVKILMGLHPHAGWRSFKTSKDVTILDFFDNGLVVYDQGHLQYVSLTTKFGRELLGLIANGSLVTRIRYRRKQFEIFQDENGPAWDERLEEVLQDIALAHSDTTEYVLEVCDMSGGEPRRVEPGEELEEIDERSDSFVV
jgi:hypothetical protein